jgi:RNA polymerase sigma factor (TIGR02999 family)
MEANHIIRADLLGESEMTAPQGEELTCLLQCLNEGEDGALDRLMEVVHDDLRGMARRHMDRQFAQGQPGVTLQPTALVNETFMKLIKQRQRYDNRGQFFAIATRLMIRVLMDYTRRRKAAKRGGGWVRVSIDVDRHAAASQAEDQGEEISALMAALEKLENLDSRKADVVKLRVLWGLTIGEIAKSLGTGRATVDRDWSFAKAWLKNEIEEVSLDAGELSTD